MLDVYNIKSISAGDYVLDLGAGIGEFAVLASKRVGDNGLVIAIEPSPIDFSMLKLNLSENKCHNVIPVNLAVSDKSGELGLSFKGAEFRAVAVTAEQLLNALKINPNKINIVKMDIEGAELYVLPQLLRLLPNLKLVSIELHGTQQQLIPFMKSHGFSFYRISKRKYIFNAIKFALAHPIQTYDLFKKFKRTRDYPGIRKILSGIEISNSASLTVGQFKRF